MNQLSELPIDLRLEINKRRYDFLELGHFAEKHDPHRIVISSQPGTAILRGGQT